MKDFWNTIMLDSISIQEEKKKKTMSYAIYEHVTMRLQWD